MYSVKKTKFALLRMHRQKVDRCQSDLMHENSDNKCRVNLILLQVSVNDRQCHIIFHQCSPISKLFLVVPLLIVNFTFISQLFRKKINYSFFVLTSGRVYKYLTHVVAIHLNNMASSESAALESSESSVLSVKELMKNHKITVPESYLRLDQEPPNPLNGTHVPASIPTFDLESLLSKEDKEFQLEKLHAICKEWGIFQVSINFYNYFFLLIWT